MGNALKKDSKEIKTDYTLSKKHTSCWITVDSFSVYIKREDEGLVVDIYGKNKEFDPPVASTYAFIDEVEEEQKDLTQEVMGDFYASLPAFRK